MHRYLKMAMQYAHSHAYDECMDYQLCSVIIRGGAVISVGYNKITSNSFVEHYAALSKYRIRAPFCVSMHAEIDAIASVRKKTDLRGAKIFVVRRHFNKSMSLYAMARPCIMCQHVLFNYGLDRAYYSIDDERYGSFKIKNPATIAYSEDKIFDDNGI